MKKLLDGLNPRQREAVEFLDGPLLILAGAGSGKTRVLTYKIGYLLEKKVARPEEILALTFTNKAAGEMKQRVQTLLNSDFQYMWIGTFHSICARILRREAQHLGYDSNFTIYDVTDQVRVLQQICEAMQVDTKILTPKRAQYLISDKKNKMISPEEFAKTAAQRNDKILYEVYAEYEKQLRKNNALDFDDLLLKPLEIFTRSPQVLSRYQKRFRYILVDEYQDTNKAQYYLIRNLSKKHRNICVVGDEDQSIYRWRGADIQNILSFENDYPDAKIVRLEQNYRSTQTILEAANSVVANNLNRLGKNLWSDKGKGEKIEIFEAANEWDEAAQVCLEIRKLVNSNRHNYQDIAILYRTNAQSRALEDGLRRSNMPYVILGGVKFYERKEVKDVLAYLRYLVNPRDSVALQRIINFPTRGIGGTSLKKVNQYATRKGISLDEALHQVDSIEGLTSRAARAIRDFVSRISEFREMLESKLAYQIASEVVTTFGLKREYSASSSQDEIDRMENINELLNSILEFQERAPRGSDRLSDFLEEVSLHTDLDEWNPDQPRITLMTLHSAKGLEFPVVMITGMEDGLFPLSRTLNDEEELEEERRLLYVGMTRAMERLYLFRARQRRRFSQDAGGMSYLSVPSRFLREIPVHYTEQQLGRWPSENSRGQRGKSRQGWKEFDEEISSFAAAQVDNDSEFSVGEWVVHESFGKGQVLSVESSRGGIRLKVLFERRHLKTIVPEYANLRKVDLDSSS